ncbi:MAG: sugar ABC transporter permease [Candidatus Dormibacteraeota bacterium]|nr:sugar ABC transporter permease [Candidatus Dormibacteraeota bacterium]
MSAQPDQTAVATAPAGAPRARRGVSLEARSARFAYYMLIPALVVVVVVALYPMINTIITSFTNAQFGSKTTDFVGLQNYSKLIRDQSFWSSVWVAVRFTITTVVFEFLLGLLIAVVVNSAFRGRGIVRASMLIPWALITVISAAMWKLMYNQIYGVFNDILVYRLGLLKTNVDWLGSTATAVPATAAIDIWKTTPFIALILLAGLQTIPSDLYEAADVDGASRFRSFFSVTLPLLMPSILVAVVFRALDALRVFDVFFVLFGGRADTTTMAVYVQENIVSFGKVGYGSAISVAILIIIGIFIGFYVIASRWSAARS